MHLFIASDYGNPVTYLLGLRLLFLSLIVGWIGFHNRWRPLLICCGVICILAAGFLYLTLGESEKDRTLTAVVSGLFVILGIVFFTAKRPDDHDDDTRR